MYITVFFIFLVLLVAVSRLRGRIEKLEVKVEQLTQELLGTSRSKTKSITARDTTTEQTPEEHKSIAAKQDFSSKVQEAPARQNRKNNAFEMFVSWVKEDWVMKLGALLVLIAFGWFVTYAFMNNWIGPLGRILFGLFAGAGILALSWWRIRNFVYQGSIFAVLGSTIVLLTMFASRTLYDLFTPLVALTVIFSSVAFVSFLSVHFRVEWLSFVGLIFAGIAPLLLNPAEALPYALFSYLLIVTLGAVWVVALSGYRWLTGVALLVVGFYSGLGAISTNADTLIWFGFAFTALFFLTNTFGFLKLKGKEVVPDIVVACGNGLFLLWWILAAVAEGWQSLTLLVWAVLFVVGSILTYVVSDRVESLYAYSGVAFALIVAATALNLHGAAFTIALIFETAAVPPVAYLITKSREVSWRASSLLILPFVFTAFSLMVYLNSSAGLFTKHFFVVFLFTAVLLFLGAFFLYLRKLTVEIPEKKDKQREMTFFGTGCILLYLLAWIFLYKWLSSSTELAVAVTIEHAFVILGFYLFTGNYKITSKAAYILAIPFLYTWSLLADYTLSSTSPFGDEFFALVFFTLILGSFGLFFHSLQKNSEDADEFHIKKALFVLSSLYAYFLLWFSLHKVFVNDDYAIMFSLAVYTIVGILTYFGGLLKEEKATRLYGTFLLFFVVGRLFFVDVWEMALTERIITFFVVGVLFVSTAFISRKSKMQEGDSSE